MSTSTPYLNLYKSASDGSEDVVVEQDLNQNWDKLDANLLAKPRGIKGGRRITGNNNLGTAVGASEENPTSMNSGTIALEANRRYVIKCRFKCQGTVATDSWDVHIEHGAAAGTGGTQIRQFVIVTGDTTLGFTYEMEGEYETSSAENKVFSLTVNRVAGSGTLQFSGGEATTTNVVGVWVEDVGAAGTLTTTAS